MRSGLQGPRKGCCYYAADAATAAAARLAVGSLVSAAPPAIGWDCFSRFSVILFFYHDLGLRLCYIFFVFCFVFSISYRFILAISSIARLRNSLGFVLCNYVFVTTLMHNPTEQHRAYYDPSSKTNVAYCDPSRYIFFLKLSAFFDFIQTVLLLMLCFAHRLATVRHSVTMLNFISNRSPPGYSDNHAC